MLDLDFAFLNMVNQNKTGPGYKKIFLDMLAPFFFAPRLQKIIKLPYMEACGGNIMIPLGSSHLNLLKQTGQQTMAQRLSAILQEYQLRFLAVDRRLKNEITDIFLGQVMVFGDNFIKALAHVFIKNILEHCNLQRIIIVGSIEDFPGFIHSLGQYGLPISIQTLCPQQQEALVHQLLYEKGLAVSISLLNPDYWENDDLAIVFADLPGIFRGNRNAGLTIDLNNHGSNLAPVLSSEFERNGLLPALYNMAPILESCLLAKAGFYGSDAEFIAADSSKAEFTNLEKIGRQWGLWDVFLDKVI